MEEMKFDAEKTIEAIKKTRIFDVDFYLTSNPDVLEAKIDPIYHYVVAGEREGRRPFLLFDPHWYGATYRVDPQKANLLIHYIAVGDKAGFNPSPYFNTKYFRERYAISGDEIALFHFMVKHKSQYVDPHPFFNTSEYLAQYSDVVNSSLPPYFHFLRYGILEGRIPCRNFSWSFIRGSYSLEGDNLAVLRKFLIFQSMLQWNSSGTLPLEDLQKEIKENQSTSDRAEVEPLAVNVLSKKPVEVFAFYLPQFHRDKHNDAWWGEGFTEWTNLSRGVPRYKGHYQPRVPGAMGFYDLTRKETLIKQAEMARSAGVTGFGIYYYNFGRDEVLRSPLRMLAANCDIQIGYFLIWANETWSRRWDGSESEVLMQQTYPKDFEKKLASEFSEYFSDPRYKKIDDNRPLLVIYRPSHIPDAPEFIQRLRLECKKRGHNPAIYIAQSFGVTDPRPFGADGALEFPPHKIGNKAHLINGKMALYNPSPELRIYSYDEFVEISLDDYPEDYRLIKTAFPSWDNDARKQGNSSVVEGSTPEKFESWLRALIDHEAQIHATDAMVCINAWNEWGEGAYLEPDRHFGYAYLNSVVRALEGAAAPRAEHVVLVGHDLFSGGAQRLLVELGARLSAFGLAVTFVIIDSERADSELLQRYSNVGEIQFLDKVSAEEGWEEFYSSLRKNGKPKYIFNTSISAQWAAALPDITSSTVILLVHELRGMLQLSCNPEKLKENLNYFSAIVFPSVIVKLQFEKFLGTEISAARICPQGVYKSRSDLAEYGGNRARFENFLGVGRKPFVVAGIGFGDLRKGFDLFISACMELDRRGVDVLFVWQGSVHVDMRRWVLSDYDYLIDRKRLLLVDTHENVGNLLSVSDVFFLSSREDPFPTVALESLALGVPVVAFAGTGGIADLIKDEPELGRVVGGLSATAAVDVLKSFVERDRDRSDRLSRADFISTHYDFGAYVRQLTSWLGVEPTVDTIVLAHNHQEFISERLQSVFRQSSVMREVIMLDAASSDRTMKIGEAECLSTHRCARVMQAGENNGYLPKLWKTAVECSIGKYLWLAEGDDSSEPTFLHECVQVLDKHPEVGFVFTDMIRIDEKGQRRAESIHDYVVSILGGKWSPGGVFAGSDFLEDGAYVANPVTNLSCVVWRREALVAGLDSLGPDSYRLRFAYDWFLYGSVAALGWKVAYHPRKLSYHRVYHASFSGALDIKKHVSEIKTIYSLFSKHAQCLPGERQRKYIADLLSRSKEKRREEKSKGRRAEKILK